MSYFLVIQASIPQALLLLCLCAAAFLTGPTRSSCLSGSLQHPLTVPTGIRALAVSWWQSVKRDGRAAKGPTQCNGGAVRSVLHFISVEGVVCVAPTWWAGCTVPRNPAL